jgi:hypothetical protein
MDAVPYELVAVYIGSMSFRPSVTPNLEGQNVSDLPIFGRYGIVFVGRAFRFL